MKKREIIERLIEVESNYLDAKNDIKELQKQKVVNEPIMVKINRNNTRPPAPNEYDNKSIFERINKTGESIQDVLNGKKYLPEIKFDAKDFEEKFHSNIDTISKDTTIESIQGKTIGEVIQSFVTKAYVKAIADTIKEQADTNTQKEDKNTVEVKQMAKKEYPKTIITNEMFEEEVNIFLNEEGYVLPVAKYTSTDNSSRFISTMIYELYISTKHTATNDIIKSKLKSKGKHYNKAADRYANIKDALARNKKEQPELYANWTVVDKINSYKDKHIQWLIDTNGTEQLRDDLQEAYIDVICYCIMAYIWEKFNG